MPSSVGANSGQFVIQQVSFLTNPGPAASSAIIFHLHIGPWTTITPGRFISSFTHSSFQLAAGFGCSCRKYLFLRYCFLYISQAVFKCCFPSLNLSSLTNGSTLSLFNPCNGENASHGGLPVNRNGSSSLRTCSKLFTCASSSKFHPVSKSIAYPGSNPNALHLSVNLGGENTSVMSCAPNAFKSLALIWLSSPNSTPMWNNVWMSWTTSSVLAGALAGAPVDGASAADQNWSWLMSVPGAADPLAVPPDEAAGGPAWTTTGPPPTSSWYKSSSSVSGLLFSLCDGADLAFFDASFLSPVCPLLGLSWPSSSGWPSAIVDLTSPSCGSGNPVCSKATLDFFALPSSILLSTSANLFWPSSVSFNRFSHLILQCWLCATAGKPTINERFTPFATRCVVIGAVFFLKILSPDIQPPWTSVPRYWCQSLIRCLRQRDMQPMFQVSDFPQAKRPGDTFQTWQLRSVPSFWLWFPMDRVSSNDTLCCHHQHICMSSMSSDIMSTHDFSS